MAWKLSELKRITITTAKNLTTKNLLRRGGREFMAWRYFGGVARACLRCGTGCGGLGWAGLGERELAGEPDRGGPKSPKIVKKYGKTFRARPLVIHGI